MVFSTVLRGAAGVALAGTLSACGGGGGGLGGGSGGGDDIDLDAPIIGNTSPNQIERQLGVSPGSEALMSTAARSREGDSDHVAMGITFNADTPDGPSNHVDLRLDQNADMRLETGEGESDLHRGGDFTPAACMQRGTGCGSGSKLGERL